MFSIDRNVASRAEIAERRGGGVASPTRFRNYLKGS